MSGRSAQHDTFTIERRYPASPARVFASFADQKKKAKWFGCIEGWEVAEHTIDFRVGGREVWRGGPPGGTQHRNDTVYHDIVADERIVWSYTMSMGDLDANVNVKAYWEFAAANRPEGWNLWLSYTLSPAEPKQAQSTAARRRSEAK